MLCMEAPPCPKDFTVGSPRAYSNTAPDSFRPASASLEAFLTLCFDTSRRNRNETAAQASEGRKNC
mgnify:CR=1 FL=1